MRQVTAATIKTTARVNSSIVGPDDEELLAEKAEITETFLLSE
jgi:hypothetical protein